MEKSPFEVVEDALRQGGYDGKMVSGQLMVQCPAHMDNNPSLAVKDMGDKVGLFCHGGCDTRDIVAELGLEMRDLFRDEPDNDKNYTVVAEYHYVDTDTGEVVWTKERRFPKDFRQYHYDGLGQKVWKLPEGVRPWLYHSPELKVALDNEEVIWIVEGEADVHAVESMGGVATTQTMGAGPGKWKPFHTSCLRRAVEVRIIVDLDENNDKGGNIGRDYALEIRDSLAAEGIKVTLWKSPVGKDASDALRAGKKLEDFTKYELDQLRVEGVTGAELQVKHFGPLIFAVHGVLPQGLAILGGPPKSAKSFVALDMAVGVATGGVCLSHLQCTLGDVLYIGLEDSERRLKSRIDLLVEGHWPDLSRIEFQTIDSEWEVGTTGRAWMDEWANNVESPRLIVVDTLGKAEPELDSTKDSYRAEQEMMLRYKRFADRHDLTVLFIHHDRKTEDDDWLNKFSGTKGLTGGADTLLYIQFKRGEREGLLRIDGRDVMADDVPIVKVSNRPFWTSQGAPRDASGLPVEGQGLSSRQRSILDLLDQGTRYRLESIRAAFPGENVEEDMGQLERLRKINVTPEGYAANRVVR